MYQSCTGQWPTCFFISRSNIIASRHIVRGTSLRNFIQIEPPSTEKNDIMSIFKMADLSHLGF